MQQPCVLRRRAMRAQHIHTLCHPTFSACLLLMNT